jgi:hypothetical protein
MPFDPISATVAGAGLIFDFIKSQQAKKAAQRATEDQRAMLAQAMSEARLGKGEALRTAGALRLDQFGNATYYDPAQGRWITSYSPQQEELIRGGQERQRRAQVRGSQASQDYDTLRGEYLYRRPKTEAESYAEIVNLINQAQGTGERQLNTLMNRFGIRTAGNIPQLQQMDTGPSPGQQLAETMLKARQAALEEYGTREKLHQGRYLPALKQFEETANYMAPVDPTGSAIVGMQQSGQQDLLRGMSDYDRLLATIAGGGAGRIGSAAAGEVKAAGGGPGASDFLNIAKMLMPGAEKGGPTALGSGARAGGGRGSSATYSGSMDALANQDAYGVTRGYGGNRPILTLGGMDPTSRLIGGEPSPIGLGGTYGEGGGDITFGDNWMTGYKNTGAMYDPYFTVGRNTDAYDFSGGNYRAPFSASNWQF